MSVPFSTMRHSIPQTPGVYFFRDRKNRILYIGKAANLRARVSSYFLKSAKLEPAKQRMLGEADHLTWEETETEITALLLEASLIKKHAPPYNIVMRDDKQYLFVGFTKEKFPRIFFTHQPLSVQSAKFKAQSLRNIQYIGPFTESGAVKNLLRSLRKAFPYCTCKNMHGAQCQHAELSLCFGCCCQKNYQSSKEERTAYQKNIRFLKNILQGKQKQLLHKFRIEMNRKSKRKEFESAAHLRDYVFAIERIFEHRSPIKKEFSAENQKGLHELRLLLKLSSYPKRIEGYDISNMQGEHAVGSMVVFTDGMADKQEYRKFRIRAVKGANDPAMMREILERRFRHADWPLPDIILIDGGKTQLNAALRAASAANFTPGAPSFAAIAKREEELYISNRKNPFKLKEMPTSLLYLLQQIRNEAHRFAVSYYQKQRRAQMKRSYKKDR